MQAKKPAFRQDKKVETTVPAVVQKVIGGRILVREASGGATYDAVPAAHIELTTIRRGDKVLVSKTAGYNSVISILNQSTVAGGSSSATVPNYTGGNLATSGTNLNGLPLIGPLTMGGGDGISVKPDAATKTLTLSVAPFVGNSVTFDKIQTAGFGGGAKLIGSGFGQIVVENGEIVSSNKTEEGGWRFHADGGWNAMRRPGMAAGPEFSDERFIWRGPSGGPFIIMDGETVQFGLPNSDNVMTIDETNGLVIHGSSIQVSSLDASALGPNLIKAIAGFLKTGYNLVLQGSSTAVTRGGGGDYGASPWSLGDADPGYPTAISFGTAMEWWVKDAGGEGIDQAFLQLGNQGFFLGDITAGGRYISMELDGAVHAPADILTSATLRSDTILKHGSTSGLLWSQDGLYAFLPDNTIQTDPLGSYNAALQAGGFLAASGDVVLDRNGILVRPASGNMVTWDDGYGEGVAIAYDGLTWTMGGTVPVEFVAPSMTLAVNEGSISYVTTAGEHVFTTADMVRLTVGERIVAVGDIQLSGIYALAGGMVGVGKTPEMTFDVAVPRILSEDDNTDYWVDAARIALAGSTDGFTVRLHGEGKTAIVSGGDLLLTPAGAVLPGVAAAIDIGSRQFPFRNIYAASLGSGSIVPRASTSAIGGHLIVSDSAVLSYPLNVGDTAIFLPFDFVGADDLLYLEGPLGWEIVQITADLAEEDQGYYVTRAIAGTELPWPEGSAAYKLSDSMVEIQTSVGFANFGAYGPAIAGWRRTDTAPLDIEMFWRNGNLRNTYDYPDTTDVYGVALGRYGGSVVTVDDTNGFRILSGSTVLGSWATDGNADFGDITAGHAHIEGTAIQLKTGTAVVISLDGTSGIATLGGALAVGSATSYADGVGAWIDSSTFRVGNPAGNYLAYNGTSVVLDGLHYGPVDDIDVDAFHQAAATHRDLELELSKMSFVAASWAQFAVYETFADTNQRQSPEPGTYPAAVYRGDCYAADDTADREFVFTSKTFLKATSVYASTSSAVGVGYIDDAASTIPWFTDKYIGAHYALVDSNGDASPILGMNSSTKRITIDNAGAPASGAFYIRAELPTLVIPFCSYSAQNNGGQGDVKMEVSFDAGTNWLTVLDTGSGVDKLGATLSISSPGHDYKYRITVKNDNMGRTAYVHKLLFCTDPQVWV